MRILILILGSIPAGLWVLEEHVEMSFHPIRYCMLIIGTICTLHALYDCMQHTTIPTITQCVLKYFEFNFSFFLNFVGINDVLCKRISNSSQGKSDAVMFAEEICGSPQCWGFLWSCIAIAAAGAAIFGLTMLSGKCRL